MQHKFLLTALLGIAIASCTSSCHSCVAFDPVFSTASATSAGANAATPLLGVGGGGALDLIGQGGECVSVDGIIQCSSNESAVTSHTATTSSSGNFDNLEEVSSDTWQLMIPNQFREKSPVQKNVVLSRLSQSDNLLVVLLKEKYPGSYDQYILGAVRAFREGGASIISSESVTIGGAKFSQLEIIKGDVTVLNWIYHSNNFGYILSCGGPSISVYSRQKCSKIAESLQIK